MNASHLKRILTLKELKEADKHFCTLFSRHHQRLYSLEISTASGSAFRERASKIFKADSQKYVKKRIREAIESRLRYLHFLHQKNKLYFVHIQAIERLETYFVSVWRFLALKLQRLEYHVCEQELITTLLILNFL